MAVAPVPGPFDPAPLLDFARAAEALGFDTIWLSDVPLAPIGDPLLSLAAMATVTSRLKLGANVVPLGRNPLVLARQLAQLDRQSDGRLLLSFVPGLDQPGERAALGVPTGDRGAALEAYIGLLRRWWAGETVDGEGGGGHYRSIALGFTPVQDPLEVWLGGAGPRALARVGRIADGWLTASVTPAEAAAGRRAVVDHAGAAGRTIDPEHFGISVPYARRRIPPATAATLRARRPDGDLADIVPVGDAALVDLLGRHLEAGLSKFVLRPIDVEPVEQVAELARLAGVVLSRQT